MFDSKYLTSDRQPTTKQLDKLCREEIHGGPNFLTWFRDHINPHLPVTCIMHNHLTYLIGSQCVLTGNVDADMRQFSFESVTTKSYGWYDVNMFRFHSTIFEASRPLAATTNIGVVTRVIDAHGHEIKHYGIIKNIIEYNFIRNKILKILFYDCDWFDPNHGTQENQFGLVEVKHVDQLPGCDPFILLTRSSKCIICHTHVKS
jgi:hypothetical protein